jgi:endonuclease/exonuclease/phosphatase family metal-dependent hydrolase
MRKTLINAFFLIIGFNVFSQSSITVVGWNIESGGAAIEKIAKRVSAMDGVDIWGFSEVAQSGAKRPLEIAAEAGENADFRTYIGTTGANDRLLIVYDYDRFELLFREELAEINIGGKVRAPLAAYFKERRTGVKFCFMVNHLYRSRRERRHMQSRLINEWAVECGYPVIAVGDYNYDWEVDGGDERHDAGFDLLTADGVFAWVRPVKLVRTQCSLNKTTNTCKYDSVLDFVFVAHMPASWQASSEILAVPGDFPDDETTSDHRPVRAIIDF